MALGSGNMVVADKVTLSLDISAVKASEHHLTPASPPGGGGSEHIAHARTS